MILHGEKKGKDDRRSEKLTQSSAAGALNPRVRSRSLSFINGREMSLSAKVTLAICIDVYALERERERDHSNRRTINSDRFPSFRGRF